MKPYRPNTSAKISFPSQFLLTGLLTCLALTVALFAHRTAITAKAAQSVMNITVPLSGNTFVEPMVAPPNTVRTTVTTSPFFKGLLSGNPATGIVQITNAQPAGTFTIDVKYIGSDGSVTTTSFILTVQTRECNTGAIFNPAPEVGTSGRASSIAVGDFNRDGNQDLAAVSFDTYFVSVRLGNGSGGFAGTTNLDLGELLPAIAAGDFNGDGKQDLAVVRYQSGQVSMLLGDGLGGFTNGLSVNVGERPNALAVADFNGDGKLDIAVTNILAQTVNVRLGDGLGGFTGSTSFAVGDTPLDLKAGDFNGDGKPDLAIACQGTNSVFIRLGDGTGGFSSAPNATVKAPGALAVGDFNGDGKLDLAATNTFSGIEGVPKYVAILLGTGTGSFTAAPNITSPLNNSPFSLAVGDFNGDNKQDLAIGNGGFSDGLYLMLRLGDGAGNFTAASNVSLDNARVPDAVAVGDFDGDGTQDFAIGSRTATGIQIRLAPQCPPPNTPPSAFPSSLNARQGDQFTTTPIQIATVQDKETPAGALIVNVPIVGGEGVATGITFDSLTNNNGVVSAYISIACDATPGVVYLDVTDGGGLTNTVAYPISLSPNQPPQLGNYAAQSVEVGANVTVTPDAMPSDTSQPPTVTAAASLGFTGTVSVNAQTGIVTISNAGPDDEYTITVQATDSCGAMTSKQFTLTINTPNPCSNDTIAPTVSSSISRGNLWPANHDLINVGFGFSAQDNCTATPALQSQVQVFANEDDETPTGDGTFSPDAKQIGNSTLRLRAERKGNGNGRVYLIVVKVTDTAGNVGLSCSTVVVPQNQSPASINAVNAAAANAKAYCLANGGARPAGYFVVGDGPIIGPKQ